MNHMLQRLKMHRRILIGGLLMATVTLMPYAAVLVIVHNKPSDSQAQAATVDCTPDTKLVNPCRPWLGAWAHDYPQAGSGVKNQIVYHEQRIGRQVDLVKEYKTQGGQLSADDKYFINRPGTYLVMTWKPASNFGAGAGGTAAVNSDIDAMADSIKSVAPKKIFLSVWHEPENDVSPGTSACSSAQGNAGSPAQYRAMWANVRSRFDARSVKNVVWTFMPMGYSGWNCLEKDMWPGNNLVDWIMWDPYGSGDNDSWNKTISPFYNWMTNNTDSSHAYTSKVWGIAETSIHWHAAESSAASFWQGAKTALEANTFPRLKAYMVFDSLNGKPDNRIMYWCKQWSGETCAAGQTAVSNNEQNAYKAFANSARITGNGGAVAPPIDGGGSGGGGTTPTPPTSQPSPQAPAPTSGEAPSDESSGDIVQAPDGESVVNAESDNNVTEGQLVTLDPSNVTDTEKMQRIVRVEYFKDKTLIQTVNKAPFVLDTSLLKPGAYKITERTYFKDGTVSEKTQTITVKAAAITKPVKRQSPVLIMAGVSAVIIVGVASFIIFRKVRQRRELNEVIAIAPAAPPTDPYAWMPMQPQQPHTQEDDNDNQQPPFNHPYNS